MRRSGIAIYCWRQTDSGRSLALGVARRIFRYGLRAAVRIREDRHADTSAGIKARQRRQVLTAPYWKWKVTRRWPRGASWMLAPASRWLGARGRSAHPRCAPRASDRACRSRRNSPNSATMQGQDQRHQHGQQGHTDTSYGDRFGTHGRSPSFNWRSGVKLETGAPVSLGRRGGTCGDNRRRAILPGHTSGRPDAWGLGSGRPQSGNR